MEIENLEINQRRYFGRKTTDYFEIVISFDNDSYLMKLIKKDTPVEHLASVFKEIAQEIRQHAVEFGDNT